MNIKKAQAKIIVIDKVQVRETYQEERPRERERVDKLGGMILRRTEKVEGEDIYRGGFTVPETRQVEHAFPY
jgi:hypothetical protein